MDIARRHTARLRLRPVAAGDLGFLTGLFGDPRVTAHRPDPRPDPPEAVARRLEADLDQWRRLGYGRWLAEAEAPVGVTGLSPRPEHGGLNLSYHLHPDAWGKGYAVEMAAEALAVAFGPLGAARVVALARPANPGSIRVLGRLGFGFEREVALGGAPTRLYALPAPALQSPDRGLGSPRIQRKAGP